MKFSRYNGLLTMRRSWPPAARTDVSMSGISVKLGRSSRQRTLRMARRSCCSSTVATQPRSLTSPGTPMNPGSSAPCPRTTSCKSGRWRRISTMMRSQTTPLHQSWRLRDHNPAGPSFSPGTSPPPLPELQTGLSFLSPAYRVQNEKSALHTNEQCGALETAWSPPLLTDCWIHSHPAYTSLWTRYPKALKHLEKDKS